MLWLLPTHPARDLLFIACTASDAFSYMCRNCLVTANLGSYHSSNILPITSWGQCVWELAPWTTDAAKWTARLAGEKKKVVHWLDWWMVTSRTMVQSCGSLYRNELSGQGASRGENRNPLSVSIGSSYLNVSQISETTQWINSCRKSSLWETPTSLKDGKLPTGCFWCHQHKQDSLPPFSQTWYPGSCHCYWRPWENELYSVSYYFRAEVNLDCRKTVYLKGNCVLLLLIFSV